MSPHWVWEAAEVFWTKVGGAAPFPRDLTEPIERTLSLTTVPLSRLRIARVEEWLSHNGIPARISVADRTLRACLVARYGAGVIFLDGGDSEDEQRFSLAHELAHFLRDYARVRERAIEKLGWSILAVLDGERLPTPDERVEGVLAGAALGFHLHLMDRSPTARSAIDRIERDADRLAFELLAPARLVGRGIEVLPGERRGAEVRRRLVSDYGLPVAEASRYAAILVPEAPASSVRTRLGLV